MKPISRFEGSIWNIILLLNIQASEIALFTKNTHCAFLHIIHKALNMPLFLLSNYFLIFLIYIFSLLMSEEKTYPLSMAKCRNDSYVDSYAAIIGAASLAVWATALEYHSRQFSILLFLQTFQTQTQNNASGKSLTVITFANFSMTMSVQRKYYW